MPLTDLLSPRQKPAFATVTIRIKPESKELLNKLAEKHNVSQGQIVDALLLQEKRAK